MNMALVNFFERHGLKMEWRFRPAFLARLLIPPLVLGVVVLIFLLANPQSNRWVYNFQATFIHRDDEGPQPPLNYTGVWYRWYWNGRLSYEEHYKNGKLDGPFRAWLSSGILWLDTDYKDGQHDGKYLTFYDTGAPCQQGEYSKETPTGHWLHFHKDGTKWEEGSFSSPGVLDGEQIAWHENGKVTRWVWHKGKPWDGDFTFERGTNWFLETYQSGTLLTSTNLGPFLPQFLFPVASSNSVHK